MALPHWKAFVVLCCQAVLRAVSAPARLEHKGYAEEPRTILTLNLIYKIVMNCCNTLQKTSRLQAYRRTNRTNYGTTIGCVLRSLLQAPPSVRPPIVSHLPTSA